MAAEPTHQTLVPPGPKNDLPLAKAEPTSKSITTSVISYIRKRKKWLHNSWREEWKYLKQPYRHQGQWRTRQRGCSRCRFLCNPWCRPWWGRLSQWSPRRTRVQQRSMQQPVDYQMPEDVDMSWSQLRSVESPCYRRFLAGTGDPGEDPLSVIPLICWISGDWEKVALSLFLILIILLCFICNKLN